MVRSKVKSKAVQKKYVKTLEHSPTLNTILMVEKVLQDMDESVIKVAELKRRLPKQVNHNTLMAVLDYLDRSNKICFGSKGITWVYNSSEKLRIAIKRGTIH